jgi:hypothetical protein
LSGDGALPFDVRDQAAFDALQAKLVPLWHSIESLNQDEQTIVVVPSADVDYPLTGSEMQAYEERYLFLLLLLRQPRARMVYVTGQAINPSIVDYYLDLMPGMLAGHARRRLFLVSPLEGTPRPLARKLLERPPLLEHIRSLIPDPDRAHLVPFATTWADRELAMRLGIPMYGADPVHLALGTKSEGRRLFAEEGLSHPLGRRDLHSPGELRDAIVGMRRERPDLGRVVVKLNEGVSGGGNANLDLAGLPAPGASDEAAAVEARLREMDFVLEGLSFEAFVDKLAAQGGIVEEFATGDEVFSPSVQMRVTPLGRVELLSTHDQLLGGASGQEFIGSRFPAHHEYAPLISTEAMKIGDRLAGEGVIGRFAIDFVVARTAGGPWRSYAIELNLRKGGTTHPFLTLQFLTDGTFDSGAGRFVAPSGREKHFVASDHVESAAFRVFTPDDLFDIALRRGIHFDHTRQVGAVFHMMSALPEKGRVGVTAVGDSPEEADARYHEIVGVLEEEADARSAGLFTPRAEDG